MASRTHDPEPLLTPAEVASMFRVDPKTVTRWAKAGQPLPVGGVADPGVPRHRRSARSATDVARCQRDPPAAPDPLDLAAVRGRPDRQLGAVTRHPHGRRNGPSVLAEGRQEHVLL